MTDSDSERGQLSRVQVEAARRLTAGLDQLPADEAAEVITFRQGMSTHPAARRDTLPAAPAVRDDGEGLNPPGMNPGAYLMDYTGDL